MDCNLNICEECQKSHEDHEIINLKQVKTEKNKIKYIENELEKQKNILNDFVINIKKLCNDAIKQIEKYIKNYIMI